MGGVNDWSTTAASNSTADATINWREGQAPSTVNNSARAMMAAIAKKRDDDSGNLVTGGSSTAYTLTSNSGFNPLVDGMSLSARMDETNGAAATLNVDATGSKPIRVGTGVAVTAGAMAGGSVQKFTYDLSDDCWYVSSNFVVTTLPLAGLEIHGATELAEGPAVADELGVYDASATANKRVTLTNFFKSITNLTAETSPATADELVLFDASDTTADKITLANLLKVINALTEDTTPDRTLDFLVTYDASATAAKKVAPANLITPGAVVAIIEDQKSIGTQGQTIAAGSDVTRTLNQLVYNRNSTVSLGSNRFTLPAGTWEIFWSAPSTPDGVDAVHQSLLHNVTDAADVQRGTSARCDDGSNVQSAPATSDGTAVVTIAGSKAFEIRHRTSAQILGGNASSQGTEVYTRVVIRVA